jgi:Cysteine-rich CWC
MTNKINETKCPLCGVENNCMAHSEQPCWCTQVKVPMELLEFVPENTKGKACICLNCIQKFEANPSEFRINNEY